MTKRFTLIVNCGTDECDLDNLYDNGVFVGAVEHSGSEMICYLLNSLSEENEQLKQQITELKKEVNELSNGEADWLIDEMI